jgi:hypothetical protein
MKRVHFVKGVEAAEVDVDVRRATAIEALIAATRRTKADMIKIQLLQILIVER